MITYYATNSDMGHTTAADCDAFRAFALAEISANFPEHDVEVLSSPSTESVKTDDIENEEEINEFCSRLWDRWC